MKSNPRPPTPDLRSLVIPQPPATRLRLRRFLIPLLTVSVSTLLALLLAEVALRLLQVKPEYQYGEWRLELDRRVLFKIKPHSGPAINSLGFRDYEFAHAKEGRMRILFLGDSFTMGHNVPPEKSLPKALERRLGARYEVFNMGIYGYGPDQALTRLLDEGFELDPDAVVLGVFPANDFGDLYKNQLYRVTPSGELEFNASNPVAQIWPRSRLAMLARKAVTCGLSAVSGPRAEGEMLTNDSRACGHYLEAKLEAEIWRRLLGDTYQLLGRPGDPATESARRLMEGVLARFRTELESRGVPFCVLIVPSYEATRAPEWFGERGIPPELRFTNEQAVEEICRRQKIKFLNLLPEILRDRDTPIYDTGDHHFSVEGNEYAAERLERFLNENVLTQAQGGV